jgi:hypothetical protein
MQRSKSSRHCHIRSELGFLCKYSAKEGTPPPGQSCQPPACLALKRSFRRRSCTMGPAQHQDRASWGSREYQSTKQRVLGQRELNMQASSIVQATSRDNSCLLRDYTEKMVVKIVSYLTVSATYLSEVTIFVNFLEKSAFFKEKSLLQPLLDIRNICQYYLAIFCTIY